VEAGLKMCLESVTTLFVVLWISRGWLVGGEVAACMALSIPRSNKGSKSMPRRSRKVVRRIVSPDAKYGNSTVAKFINRLMLRGQKTTAERIVYGAMELAGQQLNSEPAELLEQAIANAAPLVMVRPRRVGGATYQVPVEVEKDRGSSIAVRWLIASARARTGKSMKEKLAAEMVDTIQGRGATIKRREDAHRMADANKAFVHYRW